MSKQRKKSERKEAQRAAATRDNARVAKPATPKPAAPRTTRVTTQPVETGPLTFGKDTYIWMSAGFALVIIGLLLMSGGRGDDPTVFDENVIYSFRRITLAPIVILAGLGTVIFAILKK